MARSILRWFKKKSKFIVAFLLAILLIPLTAFAAFNYYYSGKMFPGVFIASINVAGLTPTEADRVLSDHIKPPDSLKFSYQNQSYNLDTKNISFAYDFPKTSQNAYSLTRSGGIWTDWVQRIHLIFNHQNLPLNYNLDQEELKKFVSVVAGQVSIAPKSPSIEIKRPHVIINRGTAGVEVDQEKLLNLIHENLSHNMGKTVQIPAEVVDQTLNDTEAEQLKTRAEKYLGKSLSLTNEFDSYDVSDTDILSFLGSRGGYDEGKLEIKLDKIATKIDRDPQNPKFSFEGGRVTEFQPALDGLKVDTEKLKTQVIDKLHLLENGEDKSLTLAVPVNKTPPSVTTDKVNNLGIKELIGRGTSTYYHSIASRVHNVVLAASRINGTLVAPGDTFSFNGVLGDVSQFTGYQQAYIISGGKTILGDGGGVCQVSTTLFRALLDAGLPITERQAHAYRVGYYEQNSSPGFDATVYSPSPDLKFKNDTPGYILIEATANAKNLSLVFELYGTSDGRVASTTKPKVTNVTAPPEDLYQDDPTLPAGTVKQIDFKAWGAKVTFNYKVTRNGETLIDRVYTSNYRPWQAVYLRGTAPAQ